MSWIGSARRWARLGGLMVMLATLSGCGGTDTGCPVSPGSIGRFLARTLPTGPGGTVIAGRGGQIVYCRGFGLADRETGIAAGCDTVYDIMSITKQFTAAAVLKLEMMGRLRVSDPIGKFLGPVPVDKQTITLHQLLTHTAGLVESLGDDYDVMSRDDMLARALTSQLRSAPGRRFGYSNVGYSVLAAIIEKVSGVSYEKFLARYLFSPAGMTQTGYVLPGWSRDRVAVEYDRTGRREGRPFEHPWAAEGPYWNLRGNGGLLSTPRDMFRWQRALSGDGILSEAAKQELFRPWVRMPDSDDAYGYGWIISDTDEGRLAWHDGGNSWSLATFAMSPRNGVMAFWISNHAYQEGQWNLENMERKLTLGIACRARDSN